jgi:hypothetical protein
MGLARKRAYNARPRIINSFDYYRRALKGRFSFAGKEIKVAAK